MIAYAYIHKASLERIKGVFADIEVMTMPCRVGNTLAIEDPDAPFWSTLRMRYVVFNRIIIVRSGDLPTIQDRCVDFGIRGLRWTTLDGELYGEYAYRSQAGEVVFRLASWRKQRRFKPDAVSWTDVNDN